ncbi:SKA complex subunit 1-like [Diretmus argenteus]
MSDLEDVSRHINERTSSLRRMLDLSVAEIPQNMMKKFAQEVFALDGLLDEFEKCVGQQKEQIKCLKEVERSLQKDLEDVQHLNDNIPVHMPRRRQPTCGSEPALNQYGAAGPESVQQEHVKKTSRNPIKEMENVTMPEFENIPQYMKGRTTYHQLNVVVEAVNKAVMEKYKILRQKAKTLNNNTRQLQQRFKDQETKDTKGHFFVVETDIQELAQVKVDKLFHATLNMLRHCQRLREVRGGGVTRYMLA